MITVTMSSFVLSCISEVVDEMQQGLYPDRYYVWKDMVINSSGVLLGVVLINAMTAPSAKDWNWLQQVLRKKIPSIILFLGICGAVFTGYLLWQIKADLVSTSFSWFVTVRFHIKIIHLISTFTLLTNFEFS